MKALLETICFISRGAKYQKINALWTITAINNTHNPKTKA